MWQKFIETLNALNKCYRALIELSEKKHKALVVIDLKTVEKLNDEEAKLTHEIESLERERQKALIDLAVENRSIKKDTKIEELARLAPTPQHKLLLEKLYQALTESTGRARELADNNRLLIEGALHAVNYHLNRLSGTKVEPTYGNGGQEVVTHGRNFEFDA